MREVERKFRVHDEFTLPELTGEDTTVSRVEDLGAHTLEATYFDTADLRIARARITLRRRSGGPDAGWHLKLPVAGAPSGVREELQRPLAGRKPPAELRDLVRAQVRTAALEPVAALRTRRHAYDLYAADGTVVGQVVDDNVAVLDGQRSGGKSGRAVTSRFRELEVEAHPGQAAFGPALDEVCRRLQSAGAVEGEFVSKAVRALGAQAAGEPDVVVPEAPSPEGPAREAIRSYIATQVAAVLREDPRVRLDLDDSVHQLRVACRRLRSGLKTFGPLLEETWTRELRAELSWLAGSFGDLRDREVLLAHIEADLDALARDPEVTSSAEAARTLIRRRLRREMSAARRSALAAMGSDRYLALLDRLVEAARAPRATQDADQPAERVLPPLVAASWTRLAKRARKLTSDSPAQDWHETRIAAKRARYAGEACVAVFGKPAKRYAAQVERLTELLGGHQDTVVTSAALRAAVTARTPAAAAFALGELHARQRESATAARAAFGEVWPEVQRAKWRRWLR
ncbi:CYTH and CHAD domain-containing protein [soil metagenome]